MIIIRLFLIVILTISNAFLVFGNDKSLKIHFIDVDDGDCILVQTPEDKAVLVDSGNPVSGFKAAKYLEKNNIKKIDRLIFTHPHLDHIGGVFFIGRIFPAGNIYDNGQVLDESCGIHRWYEQLVRKNKDYAILTAGDIIRVTDVTLRVLWPPQPLLFSDSNGNSIVLMLEYGKFRCLLTGDLTIEAEKELLKQRINLKADVLKTGHHGAQDSNSEDFLRMVSPQIAVVSVDAENIRGYPKKEIIDRLVNSGVKLYRTDRNGNIILTIHKLKNGDFDIRIRTDK